MRHFPRDSSRQEAHAATQARLKQKLERLKELPLLPWIGDHASQIQPQTRQIIWNIIFLRVRHHKYLDAGCAQRCGALATQLSAKKTWSTAKTKKVKLPPLGGGVSKVFLHPPTPNPELTQMHFNATWEVGD